MKKIFYIGFTVILALAVISCNTSVPQPEPEVVIDQVVQNTNDNEAALLYLDTHFFDAKGNVKEFLTPADNVNPKLSTLNPITLPSGVIYIKRSTPVGGQTILPNDSLHLQIKMLSYFAEKKDNISKFGSEVSFINTIATTGVPVKDPPFYHVKQDVLTAYPAFGRSYYEIEGLQEGLKYMNSYEIGEDVNYNFQGLIIVPSRAAFARDDHFNYIGFNLKNRCFVANVQVYKRFLRP